MYLDKSNKNDNVTTIGVNGKWAQDKRLKSVDVALTHHEELKELTIKTKQLAKLCKTKINEINKIYKVYLNN